MDHKARDIWDHKARDILDHKARGIWDHKAWDGDTKRVVFTMRGRKGRGRNTVRGQEASRGLVTQVGSVRVVVIMGMGMRVGVIVAVVMVVVVVVVVVVLKKA